MENKIQKYTLPAIALHWVIALLIIILFAMGLYMVELPEGVTPSVRAPWFAWHKTIGILVFLLLLIRVIWRFTHQPPALPDTVSAAQKKFISVMHKLFYVSMFIQPISGYLSSSFSGYKTKFFGYPLPQWGWKDEQFNQLFGNLHEISAVILASFIVIHLAGIVSHKLKGDGQSIMQRMLP